MHAFYLSKCAALLFALASFVTTVTAAAATADKVTPVVAPTPRVEASVSAESALIDKETGRIFWEGGSKTTLAATLGPTLSELGIRHVKARILSGLLLLALVGAGCAWLRDRVNQSSVFQSPGKNSFVTTLHFILQWTLLRMPTLSRRVLGVVVFLYLVEAYNCSTRRYLSKNMDLEGFEEYIESLRKSSPKISWTVRAYRSLDFSPTRLISAGLRKLTNSTDAAKFAQAPTIFSKKVISTVATKSFKYPCCSDDSVAGLWERAPTSSRKSESPPFCKVAVRQHVLLQDGRTTDEYLKQQGSFMSFNVQGDQYAEYATRVELPDFCSQILVVRKGKGHRLFMFWLFTLLGLTVTYREWFANQCDSVQVTIVKEVNSNAPSRSWFKKPPVMEREDLFPALMKRLRLYGSPLGTSSDVSSHVPSNASQTAMSTLEDVTTQNITTGSLNVTEIDNHTNKTSIRSETNTSQTIDADTSLSTETMALNASSGIRTPDKGGA